MTVPKSLAETHETARIVKSRSMSRSLDPTQIVERDVDSSRLLAFYPETTGDEFFLRSRYRRFTLLVLSILFFLSAFLVTFDI